MIEVELPDGSVAEFPDGTPPAVMKQAIGKKFGQPAPQVPINPLERAAQVRAMPADQREMPSERAMRSPLGNLAQTRGQSFGQGAADTGGWGFADEAGAGVGSMLTGNSYGDTLKEMRDIRAGAQQQNPGSYLGGQIAGAVAPAIAGGTPAALRGGASLASRMRVGAGAGAVQGGIYGAGSGEGLEDRIAQGIGGAVAGAGVGAVAPAVASALTSTVSKAAGAFNKPFQRMSLAKMNANKTAAYNLSEKAGVIIKPQGIQHLASKVQNDLADFGYDESLHPGAKAVLNKINEKLGQNVTLKGLDTIRKTAMNAFILGNKSNNTAVSKIVGHIDELIESNDPNLMAGINTPVGTKAIKLAREYAKRAHKLETAENLIKKGNQQADRNITDTRVKSVKSQLGKINDPFSNWGRGFNAAEKEAAGKAARYTTPQRLLHGASVLNPGGGGKLSAGIQLAGAMAHGFNPALIAAQAAGAGAGYGFQKAGEALANKSVREFVDIVANGGVPPQVIKNAMQRLAESKRNAITQALLRAGVVVTPTQAGLAPRS
jgi:hypothetical protein